MATLSNPDVDIIAARLATGERVQATLENGLVLTPLQQETVKKMLEKINEGDANTALLIPATEFQHYSTWENTVEKVTLTGIDPITHKRVDRYAGSGGTEAARRDRIKGRMGLYTNLRALGFASMAPADQTTLRAELADFIKSRAILVKAYETIPRTTPPTIEPATLDKILSDEALGDALMNHLNDIWKPENISDLSTKEQSIVEKENEIVKKKAEKQAATDKKTNLDTEFSTAKTKREEFDTVDNYEYDQKDFDPSLTTGIVKVFPETALNTVKTTGVISTFIQAYDRYIKATKSLQSDPSSRTHQMAQSKALSDMNNYAFDTTRTDQEKFQMAMFQDLSEKKDKLQVRLDNATKQKAEQDPLLDQEIAAKDLEIQATERELQPLIESREEMGKELEKTVDKALYNASGKFLTTKVQERSAKARQETQNVVNEAKQGLTDQEAADLQAIQDHIQKVIDVRYLETREVKNRDKRFWQFDKDDKVTTYVPNEIQINADRKILFNPAQGPGRIAKDIVLNSICSGGYNPTTLMCTVPGEEKRRKAIMENKQYMDSLKSQVAIKILGGMTESGMHITPQEITLMGTSTELKPMFQQWVDRNAETKKFMADAKANGLIKNGDLSEFMKKYGTTAVLAIVLISLFGIGSTVGLGTFLGSLGGAATGLFK